MPKTITAPKLRIPSPRTLRTIITIRIAVEFLELVVAAMVVQRLGDEMVLIVRCGGGIINYAAPSFP